MTGPKKTNPIIEALIRAATPRPPLTLTEWMVENVYLDGVKFRPYPYQPGIFDAFTDRRLDVFALSKSARVGYTLGILGDTGYHIDYNPCKQMIVQPTVDEAQGFSKDDLQEFIDGTPALSAVVADVKSRGKDQTILRKTYPGGVLDIIGANAPTGFRRRTRKRIKFDEVDGYPAGGAGKEGDQIKLGMRRTMTYWDGMVILGSTPTIKDVSRIESNFELGDQRRFFVPCPHCGHFQHLVWGGRHDDFGIKWPKDNPHRAYYLCINCGKEIDHRDKFAMIGKGEWRPTAEPQKRRWGSAHIWAAYSFLPKAAWGVLAEEFVEASHDEDPEKLKLRTFVNTILGETWEEIGDRVDTVTVQERVETYETEAPSGVLVVTAGVDVQADRLEMEVVGWGLGFESWSLDYNVIEADDPADANDACWDKLAEQLDRAFKRPDGSRIHITGMGLDTGYATDAASEFAKRHAHRRVYALMGSGTPGARLVKAATKTRRRGRLGFVLYHVGTDSAKQTVYARLKLEKPGPGYCHFPEGRDEHYFDMLTAEEQVVRYKNGVPYKVFAMKPGKRRNEALDCRCYAYVALVILKPAWKKIAAKVAPAEKQPEPDAEPEAAEPKPVVKRKRPRKKTGWVNGWKK